MFDGRNGRHLRARARGGRRRAQAGLAAMIFSVMALVAAAGWLAGSSSATATAPDRIAGAGRASGGRSTAATIRTARSPNPTPSPAAPRPPRTTSHSGLALSHRARRPCPAAARACVDLADHVTWLQSDGRITFGPVRMKPGGPGDPTPRGIFHVAWKAGAHYISTSFGVPIPYAVFFAPGGIAFHAGSLAKSSHGCVHLTLRSARYYHNHLGIGAEVAVY